MSESWRRHAVCRTMPPGTFFVNDPGEVEVVKKVCRGCPVVEACAAYALAQEDAPGVWGAMSEADRHKRRRQGQTAARKERSAAALRQKAAVGSMLTMLERQLAHPGRWVWVRNYAGPGSAGAVASQLRSGDRLVPPGRWQFEARASAGGGSDLYALYEGADEAAAS